MCKVDEIKGMRSLKAIPAVVSELLKDERKGQLRRASGARVNLISAQVFGSNSASLPSEEWYI